MAKQAYKVFLLLCGTIIFSNTHLLQGAVTSVAGDTGSDQTGVLTLTGGTSGALFDSTTSTITQKFNFISLPLTSATEGQIIIADQPVFHKFPGGNQNNFVGAFSGNFDVSGNNNTGDGDASLNGLTTGNFNTAVGYGCLSAVTEGNANIGVGYLTASSLVSGNSNVIIGDQAGNAYASSESNNIIIGSNPGVANESFTTRIGLGQEDCYIEGIYTSPINFATGLEVFIDDQGKLGTVTNIVNRVNNTINTLSNESDAILNLNPICAVPKNKSAGSKRFALLANEAQKVCPDLIIVDKKGKPAGVKHQDLTMLMLDQLQKQNARIQKLEKKIQKLLDKVLR